MSVVRSPDTVGNEAVSAVCDHCGAAAPAATARMSHRYRRPRTGAGIYTVMPIGWWTPKTCTTLHSDCCNRSYWKKTHNWKQRIVLCPEHAHMRKSRAAMRAFSVLLELQHG